MRSRSWSRFLPLFANSQSHRTPWVAPSFLKLRTIFALSRAPRSPSLSYTLPFTLSSHVPVPSRVLGRSSAAVLRFSSTSFDPASPSSNPSDKKTLKRPFFSFFPHIFYTDQKEQRISSAEHTSRSVHFALLTNAAIVASKFFAFFFTGSASMLSESIHSLADTCNQAFLAYGLKVGKRSPDESHPYGYGREHFLWALISATGVLFLGCGATVYHGVSCLITPQAIESLWIAGTVLAISGLLEVSSLIVAIRAVRSGAKEAAMSFRDYLISGPDPISVAVCLEDTAAVAGCGVAAVALGMTWLTGNPMYDAVGSVVIGGILGGVAIFLMQKNREFLTSGGGATSLKFRNEVVDLLNKDDVVAAVYDVKTELMGPGKLRFKAELEFNGRMVAEKILEEGEIERMLAKGNVVEIKEWIVDYGDRVVQGLGREVDRLEGRIKQVSPQMRHIDLESHFREKKRLGPAPPSPSAAAKKVD